MKSVIQNYKTGVLQVEDIPTPQLRPGWILVRNAHSLISAGTEKTKVDTAKKSLIGKAMSRPDLVKKVIEKARKDGVLNAWQAASARLDEPMPLGYSCAGQVIETAGDVDGIACGDWVACGGDFANHSEIVSIPKNLATIIPDGVDTSQAAFATVGAIAMQGVRQADVRLGETIAVIGLGLVGLLTNQLLKASGCKVIGIDIDPYKLDVAKGLGCDKTLDGRDNVSEIVSQFTNGYGVDATIITAGTKSNVPVETAGDICRENGRVIVVGATGLTLPREPYYMKEIEFKISRSYGPGRYDPTYELEGIDYPYGYVRFTEKRNMACFLDLVESGQIDLGKIMTHRFSIDDAAAAYDKISGPKSDPYLGILLEYPRETKQIERKVSLSSSAIDSSLIKIGAIGAGNYATANLLPHIFENVKTVFGSVCTGSGISATKVAKQFNFESAESDSSTVIKNSDAVVIATRHNDHAELVSKAIKANKPVFVEKPLAISKTELDELSDQVTEAGSVSIMVGFNRRFSPAFNEVQSHFKKISAPRQILIRVNAGQIPSDHWIQNPKIGGGRLIGEGCHFVDLAIAIADSEIKKVQAISIDPGNVPTILRDNFSIQLSMANGSIATIVYTSIGDGGLPKELVEVSSGGRSAVIDDFRSVALWANGKRKRIKWGKQDKGQKSQVESWINSLVTGSCPIPWSQLLNTHEACFAAVKSFANGQSIEL